MKVRVAHASLQFSDNAEQHTADIEKIFDRLVSRRVAWISGTEAGPGANNTSAELVRVAKEHGYRPWVPSKQAKRSGSNTDCWLAVREDLISGHWETGFEFAIPGSTELYANMNPKPKFPRWGPKGLVHASFDCNKLGGRVNLGVAHYLTGARDPQHSTEHGVDHWEWNAKLAEVIAEWAKEVGRGHDLAFYTGDQNMADSKNASPQGDTFMGGPLTSLADELEKWQSTGHGPIDVIASYNKDRRVSGLTFEVFDDREFSLNTDHFYCEGLYNVEPVAKR